MSDIEQSKPRDTSQEGKQEPSDKASAYEMRRVSFDPEDDNRISKLGDNERTKPTVELKDQQKRDEPELSIQLPPDTGKIGREAGLQAHEGKSLGHLLEKHVGRSDEQLTERLNDEPNIPAATTFTDRATAEKVVVETLSANQKKIENWETSGKSRTLALDYNGDSTTPVGHGIVRGDTASRSMSDAQIILKREKDNSWFILTGYPRL